VGAISRLRTGLFGLPDQRHAGAQAEKVAIYPEADDLSFCDRRNH